MREILCLQSSTLDYVGMITYIYFEKEIRPVQYLWVTLVKPFDDVLQYTLKDFFHTNT